VAIGNEKVWTLDDPRAVPPALLGMDLVRLGLERGRSADEALDAVTSLLAAHGQGGSGEEHHDEPYWSSFLLVDGDGGWVLETSGRSWVARPAADGAAISNRLTLGTDWTRSSADVAPGADWDARRDPAAPTGIADHRLGATRACVARGPAVGPAEAVAVLRDHGTGPWGAPGAPLDPPPPPPGDVGDDWSGVTVCMHVRGYQGTTASMVADLPAGGPTSGEPLRVWASLGPACTGVFLPIAVCAATPGGGPVGVVPEVLGDAGAWRVFAALGRAVEAPGEAGASALARIRAGLAPVEAGAWAEGDDLSSSGAGPGEWRAAADRWSSEVRAALGRLSPVR
jgi:secernin